MVQVIEQHFLPQQQQQQNIPTNDMNVEDQEPDSEEGAEMELGEELLFANDDEDGNDEEGEDCFCPNRHRKQASDPHTNSCIELKQLRNCFRVAENVLSEQEGNLLETSQTFLDQYRTGSPAVDYMEALYNLAETMFKVAREEKSDMLLLESLRLFMIHFGRSDDVSRSIALELIPFHLVHLGRYDDLVEFVRFHIKNETFTAEQRQMAQAGQFPYVTKEGCRFKDVCAEEYIGDAWVSDRYDVLPFLVALFLMKLHLKAVEEERVRAFFETNDGSNIDPVSSIVRNWASLRYKQALSEELENLIYRIDKRHPSMLRALVYPEPLKAANSDCTLPCHFPRCPIEAYNILVVSEASFHLTPGARDLLVKHYGGEEPPYHFEPYDEQPGGFAFG